MEGFGLPTNFEQRTKIKDGVYEVFDILSQKNCIAKTYDFNSKNSRLDNEIYIYEFLTKDKIYSDFVPSIIYKSKGCLVLEKLGPNLTELFEKCGRKFTLKTILLIGMQILTCLEFIHSRNVIHVDLSTNNILLGTKNTVRKFFLIDFDVSKKYIDEDGIHIEFSDINGSFIGNLAFSSLFSHYGMELSRRDDLVSLGYILIYLISGDLPWIKQSNEVFLIRNLRVLQEKNRFRKTLRNHTELPVEFMEFLEYCQALLFEETPNYEYLKGLLKGLFLKMGYIDDENFIELNESETKKNVEGNI